MEHPERKINRLGEYDYSTGGAYFVTICTQDRKKILSTIVGGGAHDAPNVAIVGDDAHIVPKPYGIVVEKYIRNVPEIEKYVIMPDHIHMIIRLDHGSMWASTPTNTKPQHNRVSSIVRSLKILVSKEIGESIFQRSYYDHVIRNQKDYDEIWQYVENNPRKWFLEKHDLL